MLMKTLALLSLLFIFSTVNGQYFQPAKTKTENNLLKTYFLQHNSISDDRLKEIKNDEVVISLRIDEFGKVSNVNIIKSVSPEADQEAIRMVKNLIWLPATKNGYPVTDTQVLEIPFHYKHLHRLRNKGFASPTDSLNIPKSLSQKIYNFADLNDAPKPLLKNNMTLNQYIINNLKYPEEAYSRSIHGTVSLSFVIETNGLPSNIIVNESVGGGCDQEAIRLLQGINWLPGIKEDSLVRSLNNLKVSFNLGEKRMQSIPNRQGTNL